MFRLVKAQLLHNDVIGQAVLITGIQGRGSWRNLRLDVTFRYLLLRLLRGEQTGVALVMAHSVLEEITLHRLMAPNVWAGVNTDVQLSYISDSAADIVISIGKSNLVTHLIGQFTLQIHRFPLDWLMGKAIQLLQPEGAEYRSNLVPGHGQPCDKFVLNVYFQADRRSKIVRSISGFQRYRIIAVGKGF